MEALNGCAQRCGEAAGRQGRSGTRVGPVEFKIQPEIQMEMLQTIDYESGVYKRGLGWICISIGINKWTVSKATGIKKKSRK